MIKKIDQRAAFGVLMGFVIIIMLSACSTYGVAVGSYNAYKGTKGSAVGEEALTKQTPKEVLHVGNTTKAEVEKIYGEPRDGFSGKLDDGYISASYAYSKGKNNLAAYIPVVSLFKGENTGELYILSLAYDQNNTLVWYRYRKYDTNYKVLDRACMKVVDSQTDGVQPSSIKKAEEEQAAKNKDSLISKALWSDRPECNGNTNASSKPDSANAAPAASQSSSGTVNN